MPFTKQPAFTTKTTDLPDVPSPTYTPTQIKSYIQNPSDELMTNFNNAIDKLNSTTDGDSGADNIGATGFDGTPSNPQAMLEDLNTRKADKGTDWTGTWQGFSPSQVDQTIRDQVNTNTSHLADFMPSLISLGAYNDATNPDATTAAFQQAINNNKFYRIPAGTYVLNAPLTGSNFLFYCDGAVTIYVDHNGDFIDLTGSSSQTPFFIGKNVTVTKRNSYVKTGMAINQTGGSSATTVGAYLTLDNITFSNFDTGLSMQGMNWARLKCTISYCNTGLLLNGLGYQWAGNNGCKFDIEVTHCTTAIKILGDAIGNEYNLKLTSNTTALFADETGYTVQGLVSNKFNWLWCEVNTNDFQIKNGRLWIFQNIAHISGTYFFTSDTKFVSCYIEQSNGGNLSPSPLKGLFLSNYNDFGTTTLDHHSMADLSFGQRKEQTMTNIPNSKMGHLATQFIFNPILQMGIARQNYFGSTQISAITNVVSENIGSTGWIAPTNGGTLTGGQTDPYGGTTAYKFVGSDSDTKGHWNLAASSGGRTFTFHVLAKVIDKTENALLTLQLESGTEIMKNEFVLNKDGWQLYFITLPFVTGATWMNAHIKVNTTSGILLVSPCLYETETPGLSQRGNNDGLSLGENVVIENGKYKVYRSALPTTGYWMIGDIIINTAPTAATPTREWVRVTNGYGNVVGTDWIAK